MERPHYHGHRKRLRERFLESGLAGFAEHEAVGTACHRYEQALLNANRVDFAHLQRLVYDMLDFSHLLNVFQGYYHYSVITYGYRESIRFHFFNSFMRLLHDSGINEYEDPDRPFPQGHVQVMTIHQAKGLEFPVVVVGSLSTRLASLKRIDRDLGSLALAA